MPLEEFTYTLSPPPSTLIGPLVFSAHPTPLEVMPDTPTDVTPLFWPPAGRCVMLEADLTVINDMPYNYSVWCAVTEGDDLRPIDESSSDASGDWTLSPAPGRLGILYTSDAYGYYLEKFGSWLTEYVNYGFSGATSNRLTITSVETPSAGFDIRARVRCSDWTDNANGVICSGNTSLGVYKTRIYRSGNQIAFRTTDDTGSSMSAAWQIPQSSFNLLENDEWVWLRITFEAGGDGRFYESNNGSSWTLVDTISEPDWNLYTDSVMHVGATNQANSGFDGDMSHFYTYDGSGTLLHDLALDAMEEELDRNWSSTSSSVADQLSGTSSRAFGEVLESTRTVRFIFEPKSRMKVWRFFVDSFDSSVSVDEVRLWLDGEIPPLRQFQRGDYWDSARNRVGAGANSSSVQGSIRQAGGTFV